MKMYESEWEAKGPCLCTAHPAAAQCCETKSLQLQRKKLPLQKLHSFQDISIPADGPGSLSPPGVG